MTGFPLTSAEAVSNLLLITMSEGRVLTFSVMRCENKVVRNLALLAWVQRKQNSNSNQTLYTSGLPQARSYKTVQYMRNNLHPLMIKNWSQWFYIISSHQGRQVCNSPTLRILANIQKISIFLTVITGEAQNKRGSLSIAVMARKHLVALLEGSMAE